MKIRRPLTESKEVTLLRLYTETTNLAFDCITGPEIS